MYGNWIIAKGSITGLRHIEDQTGCQDANAVFYNSDGGFGIAIVADGAGSAANAARGSQLAVENTIKIVNEKVSILSFQGLMNLSRAEANGFFIDCFKGVYEEFKIYADLEQLPVKSLATTIIVVVFGQDGMVCSHIGDGRAGYQDENQDWHPLMRPFKGEEANHTIFVTSDIWETPENFIETNTVGKPVQSFTLLSDGCESICFELNTFNTETQLYERQNRPFPGFLNPNTAVLRALNNEGKNTEEIDQLWALFLEKGNWKLETEMDDKTIILGTLKELPENG